MPLKSRLLLVPLVAVLLPCAAVAGIGYKWLRLEQDADARRGREAAEVEAVRLRRGLTAHLHRLAAEIDGRWSDSRARGPFADPVAFPDSVLAAYRLDGDGKIVHPDYEAAYWRAVREYEDGRKTAGWQRQTKRVEALEAAGDLRGARLVLERLTRSTWPQGLEASAMLELGRLSLERRDYREAESWARRILACCSAARDEYGVAFVIYAARQLTAAWRAQGVLPARFPGLARELTRLLADGAIGHPKDVLDLRGLVNDAAGATGADALLQQAEQAASRISDRVAAAGRVERWAAGFEPARRQSFSVSTLGSGERVQLLGVLPRPDRHVLIVLFRLDRIGSWIDADTASNGIFDADLVVGGELAGETTFPLAPEAAGVRLALRARVSDRSIEHRRRLLFAGSLAATLVLLGLVGYFALRDVSREVQQAALRANFVASVTHELKTPLTSIRLLAETLYLKRTRDPAVADELLQGIMDESDRLGHLVANVLGVARIDSGAASYHPAHTLVNDTVERAVARVRHLLRQGGFHLVREGDATSLRVRVDPEGLVHALVNLLANAVKYSGSSREVRIGVFRTGEEVELRVTDRGIGIQPGDEQRIFDRFYRAADAAREASGTGIGLALVRHFADAHGGRVTVASEPGRGSTFSLWLPLLKPNDDDVPAPDDMAADTVSRQA